MLQLSKIIASLFAGCFCTWTIQQVPALGETLLPQTHPIPDHIPPVSAAADVLPSETLPIPAETAPALSVPPTEARISQTETVSAAAAITTTCPIATATTTLSSETTVTDSTETETAAASTQATIPQESQPKADPFFRKHETWFKAYMDYRTITDTESVQYAMQQNAWTDDRGLRRTENDYLVAMDRSNLRDMARFVGNDPLHKVSLLMSYTSTPHDVADPWFTGNFEDTWRDVLAGCTALLSHLQ